MKHNFKTRMITTVNGAGEETALMINGVDIDPKDVRYFDAYLTNGKKITVEVDRTFDDIDITEILPEEVIHVPWKNWEYVD